MTMQWIRVAAGAAVLGWLAGCATGGGPSGEEEAAAPPPSVEDRPVPGGASDTADPPGAATPLPGRGDVAGDPLRGDPEGASLTRVLYFEFDSSEIHPDDRVLVEAHAQYLAGRSDVRLILEGHADERGSREYNVALAERRAVAVRDMLRLLGAPDDRVSAVSYGEERPIALGNDEESWALNRRVEFNYVSQ